MLHSIGESVSICVQATPTWGCAPIIAARDDHVLTNSLFTTACQCVDETVGYYCMFGR